MKSTESPSAKAALRSPPDEWDARPFDAIFRKRPTKAHQIQTSDYRRFGQFPVVDQGKSEIVAFTDIDGKAISIPKGGLVVFGDHTCIVKFVDFDFVIGADGTQVLETKGEESARFHAYSLQYDGVEPTGYNRHFKDLKERHFLCPPLGEQHEIESALQEVDDVVASLDALIAKKRDIKHAAMQQLLTGKIRLTGFTKAWTTTTVGEVISSYFCGPSPTCFERNIEGDEEWGVLKTTAITWENGWDWTKHKTLPRVHWGRHSIELKTGDVLVTKAGPRHRVGVCTWVDGVPHRIVPSGKMIALRPKVGVALAPLLSAAIAHRDAQGFLDQRTTGMAESQVNFENQDLLDTPISLPEYEEQKAIASIMSDIDNELSLVISKRKKLDPLKEGMMQQLLTGRIRLV